MTTIRTAAQIAAGATSQSAAAVLPVLYIGLELPGSVIRQLWTAGIGVLPFTSAKPALRLLQHARPAAILYGAMDRQDVNTFVATGTPVIVLATDDAAWDAEGVTVVDRQADPATLAALIRHAVTKRVA